MVYRGFLLDLRKSLKLQGEKQATFAKLFHHFQNRLGSAAILNRNTEEVCKQLKVVYRAKSVYLCANPIDWVSGCLGPVWGLGQKKIIQLSGNYCAHPVVVQVSLVSCFPGLKSQDLTSL